MSLPDPLLHLIQESNDWPNVVRTFVQNLDLPLPQYVLSSPDDNPHISETANALFLELQNCRKDEDNSHCMEPNCQEDSTSLRDVFNLLLMSVVGMRQLDAANDLRLRKSLLCSLFSALCNTVSQDVHMIIDSPFLLPQTKHCASYYDEEPTSIDGHALLLVSHHVAKEAIVLPQERTTVPSGGCYFQLRSSRENNINTESGPGCPTDKAVSSQNSVRGGQDARESKTAEEDTHPLSDDSSSLHVPFDAHILLGQGRRKSAEIPLVVVADSENIIPLITSALYQRYVWSVDEPVIGFEILRASTTVQVRLGWVVLDDDQSPTVHITHVSTNVEALPSLGLYNLTNPSAACALAQFIFSLQEHWKTVTRAVTKPQIRNFCWRFDHHDPDGLLVSATGEIDRYTRILRWLADLPKRAQPDLVKNLAIGVNQLKDDESSDHGLRPPSQSDSMKDAKEKKPKCLGETISCSSFGNRPASGLDERRISVTTWLFERGADLIAKIPPHVTNEDYASMTRMIGLYDELTKPVLIPGWDPSHDKTFPACCTALKPFRNILKAQYHDLLNTEQAVVLDTSLACIIEDRLDALLISSSLASAPKKERETHSVKEAEIRQVDIRFSRNRIVDMLAATMPCGDRPSSNSTVVAVKEYMKDAAYEMRQRCLGDLSIRMEEAEDDMMVAAFFAAVATRKEAFEICEMEDHDMLSHIWSRAGEEPVHGICDVIAFRRAVFKSSGTPRTTTVPFPKDLAFVITTDAKENGIDTETEGKLPATEPEPGEKFNRHMLFHSRGTISELPASSTRSGASGATTDSDASLLPDCLLLPVILAEYTKNEDTDKALHQLYTFMVSAVDKYAHLELKDHPVWGVFINGEEGSVLLAWRSAKTDRTYVIQRKIRTFDITEPLQVVQFASFLLRVRASVSEMYAPLRDVEQTRVECYHATPKGKRKAGDGYFLLKTDANYVDPENRWPLWTKEKQSPVPEEYKASWAGQMLHAALDISRPPTP
ncbi:unnamed protein product [Somion occarium]|uniref:Uncharacterized protein n=1 Tax=Somion occarium TaxID=3059160 RepID=A0ABP1DDU7_9APHY